MMIFMTLFRDSVILQIREIRSPLFIHWLKITQVLILMTKSSEILVNIFLYICLKDFYDTKLNLRITWFSMWRYQHHHFCYSLWPKPRLSLFCSRWCFRFSIKYGLGPQIPISYGQSWHAWNYTDNIVGRKYIRTKLITKLLCFWPKLACSFFW